jgi:hypothetical protein
MSYVALATVTLGSAASSVTFSSIPATYRDLVFVINAAANSQVLGSGLQFNGDTSDSYPYVQMFNTSSNADIDPYTAGGYITNNDRWMTIAQIMDYSATDKHKTVLARHNNVGGLVMANASRWPSTAAINQMVLISNVSAYQIGTTIALYGIAG